MKNLTLLCLVVLTLTGCQWSEKRAIKKSVEAFYARPLCLDWQSLKSQDEPMAILRKAGLIQERPTKQNEGIMGYALQKDYELTDQGRKMVNDKNRLCYGAQHVEEVKAIDFDHETQATASFVLSAKITQDWAKTPFFIKRIATEKELRRAFVYKKPDGGWQASVGFTPVE